MTDPPNDEAVNYQTQLNENWSEIDDKITPFNSQPANFTGIAIPVGTEAIDYVADDGVKYRVAVWDGTKWNRTLNHSFAWTPWQILPVRAPVVAKSDTPPMIRVNLVEQRVVLMGGVIYNATADAWPANTDVEITTDTAVESVYAPYSGLHVQQLASGVITTANSFASAVASVSPVATRTAIKVRYQGDAGGGNFIQLDGLEWWY